MMDTRTIQTVGSRIHASLAAGVVRLDFTGLVTASVMADLYARLEDRPLSDGRTLPSVVLMSFVHAVLLADSASYVNLLDAAPKHGLSVLPAAVLVQHECVEQFRVLAWFAAQYGRERLIFTDAAAALGWVRAKAMQHDAPLERRHEDRRHAQSSTWAGELETDPRTGQAPWWRPGPNR